MKTLIVRKIDDTGRIVIPMEIRKELGIKINQYMSIERNEDKIVLEKYSYDTLKEKIVNAVEEIVCGVLKKYKVLLCIDGDICYKNYDETYNNLQKLSNLDFKEQIKGFDLKIGGKDISFVAIKIDNNYGTEIGYLVIKNYVYKEDDEVIEMISLLLNKINKM